MGEVGSTRLFVFGYWEHLWWEVKWVEEHRTWTECCFYFSVSPCKSSENSTSERKRPLWDMSGETEKQLMEFWVLD